MVVPHVYVFYSLLAVVLDVGVRHFLSDSDGQQVENAKLRSLLKD